MAAEANVRKQKHKLADTWTRAFRQPFNLHISFSRKRFISFQPDHKLAREDLNDMLLLSSQVHSPALAIPAKACRTTSQL